MALKRILLFLILTCSLGHGAHADTLDYELRKRAPASVKVGAARMTKYKSLLEGKRVGVVGNQTSLVKGVHLVDTLLASGVQVVKVFSPEHGFRGKADAGEALSNSVDKQTGLPIISLYGNNKKPTAEQLSDIDVLLFDLQDVGVRFYTYISTLHYIMEAGAEMNIPVIVLDRPNPNGHYVDGPVRQPGFESFIGMHPVPIVYGMTIGEYARMINGEHWLKDSLTCALTVIPLQHYTHETAYSLPVNPSPNLRTDNAINLYPSLCLFEGTVISVGRGTDTPFEVFGHPTFPDTLFSFTPVPGYGASNPKLNGKQCFGFDLSANSERLSSFSLEYLITARRLLGEHEFIESKSFFNKLAGNDVLMMQLIEGVDEETIRASWEPELSAFKKKRKKYLLYED